VPGSFIVRRGREVVVRCRFSEIVIVCDSKIYKNVGSSLLAMILTTFSQLTSDEVFWFFQAK
jgi:hypothetical protein